MIDILVERTDEGAAVVFSSHQLDLVEDLCEDVVIIAAGKVVLSGPVRELRARSHHRYLDIEVALPSRSPVANFRGSEVVSADDTRLRLRVGADTDLGPLIQAANDLGQVTEFSFTPPNLSEVFREVVEQ